MDCVCSVAGLVKVYIVESCVRIPRALWMGEDGDGNPK